jgi:hypothetical protein
MAERLTCIPLIPLHQNEIPLKRRLCGSKSGLGVARPAMQKEKYRLRAICPANRDPLLDATDVDEPRFRDGPRFCRSYAIESQQPYQSDESKNEAD